MKLKEIEIRNFRSIENIKLDFKQNPRILVGINESGKTNILEALRLISKEFSPTRDDVRITEKGVAEESLILVTFEFEENELEEIYQKIQSKILTDDYSKPIVKVNNKEFSLKDLILEYYNEVLYIIDVKNKKREFDRRKFKKEMEFIIPFKKPKPGVVEFDFEDEKGEKINIRNFELIDPNKIKIPATFLSNKDLFEEATPEILDNIIGSIIIETVSKNLPKVIHWKYDERNLLPPSILIETFVTNPDSCIPLKNMFILADIPKEKISKRITETRELGDNPLRTLFKTVADEATQYFRKVWPEYKNIKFSLELNGDKIDCGVEEKTIQDFKLRSDGFKRFITLLLLLVIPAEKGLLKNALVLIDEADQSLHPSGCRYLMEQLIKLAENNYVIYSTHSIFMIDRTNIERHYIVKKEKEITTITEANEENYFSEEVLYKALGASVYEILKEKNILFEGWRDKKLFETAIEKDENLQKFFKEIGISHAEGVKSPNIPILSSILESARRKLFIISDADSTAKEKQKEFEKKAKWGIWKRYDEILSGRKVETSEDFIKKDILKNKLYEILKEKNINLPESEIEFPDNGRLNYISKLLEKHNVKEKQQIIKDLKDKIFKNLQPDEIEEDYFQFLKILKEEIERL